MQKKKAKRPKAKSIAIIIAGLVILGLVAFGIIMVINRTVPPVFNNGSELSVVNLTTNGGVAYEWNCDIKDTAIVELIDVTSAARDNNDGGVVDLQYIFKGKKAGRTTVVFKYGSFINGSVIEEKTYLVEVNEKLETRITEQ
jgi:hypothetical protein